MQNIDFRSDSKSKSNLNKNLIEINVRLVIDQYFRYGLYARPE